MTTYNRATLKTFFETGDVPGGQDYANLIDSCLNVVDTGVQTIQGGFNPTELITARVSAGTGNITGDLTVGGTVSAATIYVNTINITAITLASAAITNATIGTATITSANITNLNLTIASAASLYAGGLFQPVAIISATGTTQATAALCTATINNVQGAADGQTTGVILPANKIGYEQIVYNSTAVSANLYPCVGGAINRLSANAPFAMAAGTPYTVSHIAASAYAVR